jgi:hypothetical protein
MWIAQVLLKLASFLRKMLVLKAVTFLTIAGDDGSRGIAHGKAR